MKCTYYKENRKYIKRVFFNVKWCAGIFRATWQVKIRLHGTRQVLDPRYPVAWSGVFHRYLVLSVSNGGTCICDSSEEPFDPGQGAVTVDPVCSLLSLCCAHRIQVAPRLTFISRPPTIPGCFIFLHLPFYFFFFFLPFSLASRPFARPGSSRPAPAKHRKCHQL